MIRPVRRVLSIRSAMLAVTAVATLAAQGAWTGAASAADAVADFYKAHDIEIDVGYAAGGGNDLAARIVARYMPKYIPGNPKMIVRNMPGAGSAVAANHVNNVAAKDGTTIGMYADMMPAAKLINFPGIKFDPAELSWIGAITARETPILAIRSDAPATTLEGLKKTEVLIGSDGVDATSAYAFMLNDLVGTKLKVLMGYTGGTAQIDLAIERGEVHGRATVDWERLKSKTDWVKRDLVKPVVQVALTPSADPDLKDVPLIVDLAKSDEDKHVMELVLGTNRFFRTFTMAPGIPADRLAALRGAFAKTMTDPEFVTEFTTAAAIDINPATAKDIQDFITKANTFPPSVVERAAKYVSF